MGLKLYNTLSGKKEAFSPTDSNHVKMFVCGPTVQDYVHLGHAKTYIFYDVLARYLRLNGYDLNFIVNVTDVDDKVYNKAKEESISWTALGDKYTKAFIEDMKALNVRTPSDFVRVSGYVDEAIELVSSLVEKGKGYAVEGNVYFDITKAQNYGKLSHLSRPELMLKVVDAGPGKRNPPDFFLWRRCDGDEPTWKAPFSRGRPGWHIEDTAIVLRVFGGHYDIHGGATELIYPHHESELAQDESLTGQIPFVKYWVHTGMLMVKENKMSKSLKNYVTVRDALKRYDADTIRLFVLSTYYRSDINFSMNLLDAAQRKFESVCVAMHKLNGLRAKGRDKLDPFDRKGLAWLHEKIAGFYGAMDDDLNTPIAIETMVSICKFVIEKANADVSTVLIKTCDEELSRILSVLGLCGYTETFESVETELQLVKSGTIR